ncbi:MAG: hypothetical protein KC589_02415 [Nanoarchaeota archaeon]|nr:hypothetical protein [Nanoarchaeota archaeon]
MKTDTFIAVVLLFAISIFMGSKIVAIKNDNNILKTENDSLKTFNDSLISDTQFVRRRLNVYRDVAFDLSNICDQYRSSRDAKENYIKSKKDE